MERLKRMSLKKSLFVMTLISLIAAALLSALTFAVYMEFHITNPPDGIILHVNEGYVIEPEYFTGKVQKTYLDDLIGLSQILLPVLFFVGALLTAVVLFYRLKLKEPLTILENATTRIMQNDLDFSISAASSDELGNLCAAFETMRAALLANNRRLWRQTEEQKRLNAAFSHDLRNPLTVLKGSAKMAKLCAGDNDELLAHLSRIEAYTGRMERYVEIMSSVGHLEQMQLEKTAVMPWQLSEALEDALRLMSAGSGKTLSFSGISAPLSANKSSDTSTLQCPDSSIHGRHDSSDCHNPQNHSGSTGADTIRIDQNALFQIAENLAGNALRFADTHIAVSLSLAKHALHLTVSDDGPGFPERLLKNGIRPFQKGVEDPAHFGMGLYICALLSGKHDGSMEIGNLPSGGACVQIILNT